MADITRDLRAAAQGEPFDLALLAEAADRINKLDMDNEALWYDMQYPRD